MSNIKQGKEMNLNLNDPTIEVDIEVLSHYASVTDITIYSIGPMNSLTMKM